MASVFVLNTKGSNGQTIKSCGQSGDILSNAVITTDPSPIDKSKPFTITATGTLTSSVDAGNLDVDLNVKALGIINEPVKANVDFTYSPGIEKGDTKIVIGPLTLPSAAKSASISGQVKIADSNAAEIACIEFDESSSSLRGQSSSEELREMMELISDIEALGDGPVASNCGTASDHLQNVAVQTDGSTTTVTGTLDENVGNFDIDVDLEIKASFIKVPIKMDVPVSLTPAIPSGDIKASFTSKSGGLESPQISVTVNGQVKANDANHEEIGCLQLTE